MTDRVITYEDGGLSITGHIRAVALLRQRAYDTHTTA